MTLKHFIVLSNLFLTACMGVYNEDFDCSVGKGVGCRSISQVNEMVNKGKLPLADTKEEESQSTDEKTNQEVHLNIENIPTSELLSNRLGIKVNRVPEKTLRLWVAPHEAEDGAFVEETYVNLVIQPGRWVNSSQGDQ